MGEIFFQLDWKRLVPIHQSCVHEHDFRSFIGSKGLNPPLSRGTEYQSFDMSRFNEFKREKIDEKMV